MGKQEEAIQERIANYLVQNYPNVLFHSDYGSGAKLTKGQSAKQKRLNGGRRAWPDMVIAEVKYVYSNNNTPLFQVYKEGWGDLERDAVCDTDWLELYALHYMHPLSGLYLEIKKDGENIYAQRNLNDPNKLSLDGKVYADKHIKEQADVLYKLRQAGYCAEFAIGYDHAISIITDYLGEPKKQEVEF